MTVRPKVKPTVQIALFAIAALTSLSSGAIEYVEAANREGFVWIIFEQPLEVHANSNSQKTNVRTDVLKVTKNGREPFRYSYSVYGCGQPAYAEHSIMIHVDEGGTVRNVGTSRWYLDGDTVLDLVARKICEIAAAQGYKP